MNVFTKIENGKRVLVDTDDFSVDDCLFNVIKEYNFTWVKNIDFNNTAISEWQLTPDIKVFVTHYPRSIVGLSLSIRDKIYKYTRDKRVWFLNESKEIGRDSDVIVHMMETVRSNWGKK